MEVNGYHENHRYVSASVQRKQDFMTRALDPVMSELLEQLAKFQPAPGNIQHFLIKRLKKGRKLGSAGAMEDDFPAFERSRKEYFSQYVDPLIKELLRAVVVAEPDDVRKFLLELCEQHTDLEQVIMGYAKSEDSASAGAGAGSGSASEGKASDSKSESKSAGRPKAVALAPSGRKPVGKPVSNGMRVGEFHVVVRVLIEGLF